ncbi:MAG: zinc dependent phospholipase C family protein [Chloroherpetonaceae bacterium]|nr:zinc dependent phospholipase C family protein [Chthonomonadaceae bacterium]MDW8207200.1 zinc dependent phospholipase C family protein [Chloroherpetonaceae bacterium]
MIRQLRCNRVVAGLFLLLWCVPTAGYAWGVAGHRYANALAVDSLPEALRPFYQANRAWIVHHSVDPDQWRNANRSEAPHHFIDLDYFGLEEALRFPQDYWVAVGLYGRETLEKVGLVPWRIGQFYGKLVRAFRERNARAIVEISTFLGHYVADIHVPFHAVTNYDGQLTGQKGIHARFESVLVERQIRLEDLRPQRATRIADPVAAAFAWARRSMKRSADVLRADLQAVARDRSYGDTYYQTLGQQVRRLAIRCLEESGRDLASLWMSAWIDAGRPPLPPPASVHEGEPLDRPTRDPDLPPPSAD